MRVGQKNKRTYVWAKTGTRPRLTHDQRTQSLYLFGATCPERGEGAALALPECNTEAMAEDAFAPIDGSALCPPRRQIQPEMGFLTGD